MKQTEYKLPKVEKYCCPVCGKDMRVSFGSPVEAICHECKNRILEEHENDDLKNCPFCNADRSQIHYALSVPYYYGATGVRVRCKCCGATGGIGGIYHYENCDCSKPPIFNYETITNGFAKAKEKWDRMADNEQRAD